jgi:hypothetical protein
MYYHNSPTVKQLKAINIVKASEMKKHTDAMKLVTAKYKFIISMLGQQRAMELGLENQLSTGRLDDDKLNEMTKILEQNRKKISRAVKQLLPDFTP